MKFPNHERQKKRRAEKEKGRKRERGEKFCEVMLGPELLRLFFNLPKAVQDIFYVH